MTPIADMVEQMLAASMPAEMIVLAVRTAELSASHFVTLASRDASRSVTLASRSVTPNERGASAIRSARYRENRKQKQAASVAMAAAPAGGKPHDLRHVASRDGVKCVSNISNIEGILESGIQQGSKTEVVARARGKRLADDWEPSEIDLKFAARHNLRGADLENEALKFRNYWTNRTDRQASKPRWDLAWQNWVLNLRKPRSAQSVTAEGLPFPEGII